MWINYAMFVVEWQGDFNTGLADVEFFELRTGGRIDGQPIKALEPSTY
jgi:hypothetical protein